ncbi:MAG: DUF2199 domain-containing protein [Thermoleophilia bacterium]|nr:DUF2199 domain-containing protein [Thermoleophilia bacterium]
MSFCALCGESHAGETRQLHLLLPEPIFRIEEADRDGRAWVGSDSAVLRDREQERFFVRGLLELPVADDAGSFGYSTWIEVDEAAFDALRESRRNEPFAGTLASEVHPYAFTEGLPVQIHLRDVDVLPLVELDDADHELVRAQRNGISAHRAHELVATVA